MLIITGYESGLGRRLYQGGLTPSWGIRGDAIRSGKAAIESAIDDALDEGGPVTRVINNFGINHLSWIGETDAKDAEIFDANVLGPYWVINHLVARGQICRVINVASATYRVPQRTTALYCASKAALVHMTKVMARELAPKGWIINAVAPGLMTDTDMADITGNQITKLRGWDQQERERISNANIPMGRPTTTKEVANAIWKLMEMPDYVNGACLDIMGGS
jgi:NAD(P)-dependent dehydrogenase (short-subunit alcohol dehydrogenase family)